MTNSGNAYNNRGVYYFRAGDSEKAADFKKSIELDPNDKQAAENFKNLAQ